MKGHRGGGGGESGLVQEESPKQVQQDLLPLTQERKLQEGRDLVCPVRCCLTGAEHTAGIHTYLQNE